MQQPALGLPLGYGASVWNNVGYADVYYQTRGNDGSTTHDPLVPLGRPIPGAFSRNLTGNDLPASYAASDRSGDHDAVWSYYYLNTVKDASATIGYGLSRLGANNAAKEAQNRATAGPNFYDASQDHHETSLLLRPLPGDTTVAAADPRLQNLHLTLAQVIYAGGSAGNIGWAPQWEPLSIYNGDLGFAGDESGKTPAALGSSSRASVRSTARPSARSGRATSSLGGRTMAEMAGKPLSDPGALVPNTVLTLHAGAYRDEAKRVHDNVYVADNAMFLTLDVRHMAVAPNETLVVKLGTTVLARLDGSAAPAFALARRTRASRPCALGACRPAQPGREPECRDPARDAGRNSCRRGLGRQPPLRGADGGDPQGDLRARAGRRRDGCHARLRVRRHGRRRRGHRHREDAPAGPSDRHRRRRHHVHGQGRPEDNRIVAARPERRRKRPVRVQPGHLEGPRESYARRHEAGRGRPVVRLGPRAEPGLSGLGRGGRRCPFQCGWSAWGWSAAPRPRGKRSPAQTRRPRTRSNWPASLPP